MANWLRFSVVAVCGLFVLFMLYPTGSAAADVLAGYHSTLSITSSEAIPWTYYSEAKALADTTDPLIEDVEAAIGGIDGMCPYLWVQADRVTPVSLSDTTVNSSFPHRGRAHVYEDYTGPGSNHNGTDYGCTIKNKGIIYQVALWPGTVIVAGPNSSYGNYVVIDHGHGFYTLYAHMGFGNATTAGGRPLWWESEAKKIIGNNKSSLLVKVGDHVEAGQPLGTLGTTGSSTGPHAHIELQLRSSYHSGVPYRAGLTNLLFGGKSFSELKWYKGSKAVGFGSATSLEDAANDQGLDASAFD